MLPDSIIRNASERSFAEPLQLRAGPLTMLFEPETAFLRYIRLDEVEVLRGIYVAIRDQYWGTVTPQITHLETRLTLDAFQLTFDVNCIQDDIHFFWQGMILGDADGSIRFRMDGTACSTFLRSRIGFCILHPVRECAGKPCNVEYVDGMVAEVIFPDTISPHQPMMDLRAITHEVRPGILAEVRFEGDTFEMEDQRNWTDASFKTYCTPLNLPYPVLVTEGSQVTQSVVLELNGTNVLPGGVHSTPISRPPSLDIGGFALGELPGVGVSVASHGEPFTAREIGLLREMHLSHLRLDLHLSDPGYPEQLRRASDEAAVLNAKLEIAIFLSDNAEAELQSLMEHVAGISVDVLHWLVFPASGDCTDPRMVERTRHFLGSCMPDVRIGGGTNVYFTELNRQRPDARLTDVVCYTINPQVHAFDDRSLMETLPIQGVTVQNTRQFAPNRPIAVTPITLKPRFNPHGAKSDHESAINSLPAQVDVRQMSLFAAAWTLGSLKYLSESGVQSLTYYETTGWRGVMEREAGTPMPTQFRSMPGAVFPLYHILSDMGELNGAAVLPCQSSAPDRLVGMALQSNGQTYLFVANLTDEVLDVTVPRVSDRLLVRWLDETTAVEAMTSPGNYRCAEEERFVPDGTTIQLSLRPFATARLRSA